MSKEFESKIKSTDHLERGFVDINNYCMCPFICFDDIKFNDIYCCLSCSDSDCSQSAAEVIAGLKAKAKTKAQ